jgi:hypothetical protein
LGEDNIVLVWRRASYWLGNLANAAALATVVATIVTFLSADHSAAAIAVSIIAVILLLAFLAMSWLWERHARLSRYSAVTFLIESVAERSRDAQHRLSDSVAPMQIKSAYNADLQTMLTDIAQIYSYVTDRKCRATLKLLRPLAKKEGEPEDDAFVYVQARDRHSSGSFENSDKERFRLQFDRLSMNPHLRDLFSASSDGEDWDCYNDIPKMVCRAAYTSSSIAWWIQNGTNSKAGQHASGLPYASALVALVRAPNGDNLGFIGVDSARRSAFVPKTDGPLLAALANFVGAVVDRAENSTLTKQGDSQPR